ncbi:sodium pump decarboxylase subunit gamma [Marinobacter salinexigens]|uniref:Probable oxaloacetate decarboxylase gamma chain n=1 Tax=Marinobacter salinexigens TaxID=2919747 RepID=A0A5B0VI17_9GAMM|nr:OadG family transporter subunit [Marinobacter salinexigens]KAA1173765.1 sodium pump decarboxylase subunit gamma [Marinobacter salinexigens]
MNNLMSQAVDLMIAGMGFVFAFLIILVFATMAMSKLLGRFAPEPVTPAKTPRAKPQAPASVDPDTAEAIKKAIAQFRARHKK